MQFSAVVTEKVLHAFPKDTLRTQAWIIKCRRTDFINTNTARVCGDHFGETSHKRDLEHELLNLPLRKVLKDDAVPNKNLPTLNERSDKFDLQVKARDSRAKERKLNTRRHNHTIFQQQKSY